MSKQFQAAESGSIDNAGFVSGSVADLNARVAKGEPGRAHSQGNAACERPFSSGRKKLVCVLDFGDAVRRPLRCTEKGGRRNAAGPQNQGTPERICANSDRGNNAYSRDHDPLGHGASSQFPQAARDLRSKAAQLPPKAKELLRAILTGSCRATLGT